MIWNMYFLGICVVIRWFPSCQPLWVARISLPTTLLWVLVPRSLKCDQEVPIDFGLIESEDNMCTRDSKACWIQWSILVGLASMRTCISHSSISISREVLVWVAEWLWCHIYSFEIAILGMPSFYHLHFDLKKNMWFYYSMIRDMRNKDKGLLTKAVACYNNTNWELSKHTLGIWSNTCIHIV